MVRLSKKDVEKLLKSIKNKKDRKVVKSFLQNLEDLQSGKKPEDETKLKRIAKQALDILIRLGFKIGEHIMIEDFLHLFD
jgi:hypothetical protein